jgi:hypothetical protein
MNQFIPTNKILASQVNRILEKRNKTPKSKASHDDLAAIANQANLQNKSIDNHNHAFESASQVGGANPENLGNIFLPIESMNIQDCADEYMAVSEHLKKLRAETKVYNKRNKELEKKMEDFLKKNKHPSMSIGKKITVSYEVKQVQVPLTKKNIRTTLEKHLRDQDLVERIYTILTEQRDTVEKRRLKKKKYKE